VTARFLLLTLAVATTGCDQVEHWISKKADERIAREVDSAEDSLDDDAPPSGVKSTSQPKKKKKRAPAASASSVAEAPLPSVLAAPPTPAQDLAPAQGIDFLKDPTRAVKAYKDKPVSPHVVELTLYPDYGKLVAEDPSTPGKALEYDIKNEHVSDGKPPLIPPHDLSASIFDLGTIDWKTVAGLVADAPARLARPTSTVSFLDVKRNIPFDKDVVITIFIDGGTHAAEYDVKGKWIQNI